MGIIWTDEPICVPLLLVPNKHEGKSEGMLKDTVKHTEMCHVSCSRSMSVSTGERQWIACEKSL